VSAGGIKWLTVKLDLEKIKPFEIQKGGGLPLEGGSGDEVPRVEQKGGGKPLEGGNSPLIEKTIMFKEEIKEKSKTPEELGQDVREREKNITKSNQFPSIIEEQVVKLSKKEPNQDIERKKRQEEIGGFKWDEDSVNEFLNRKN